MYRLVPVDYRPRFEDGGEVYDPLAASAGIAPAGPTPVGSAMLQHAIDLVAAPGRVAAGHQPEHPGYGNATHNYVVFDDKLIDIIKKYGLAGLIGGGAAHFKTVPTDDQPQFDEAKRAKGGRVNGTRIDSSHTVTTGANSSADGKTVFVDPRIPAKFHKFLAVHETTEQKHMAGGYARAHKIATAAERKAVEASGTSWKRYTEEVDGFLDQTEHEKNTNPPPGKLHVSSNVALGHHHHHSRNK